jgi:hypothetical protein
LKQRIHALLSVSDGGILTWRSVTEPKIEIVRNDETYRLSPAQRSVAAVGSSPSGETVIIASDVQAPRAGSEKPRDALALFDAAKGAPVADVDLPSLGWYTYSVAVNDEASVVAAAVAPADSLTVSSNVVRYFRVNDETIRTVSFAPALEADETALVDSLVFDGGNLIIAFPPENSCVLAAVAYETSDEARCVVEMASLPTGDLIDPVVSLLNSCNGVAIVEVHPRTNPLVGDVFRIDGEHVDPIKTFPASVHGYSPSLNCDGTFVAKSLSDPTRYETTQVSW